MPEKLDDLIAGPVPAEDDVDGIVLYDPKYIELVLSDRAQPLIRDARSVCLSVGVR